MLTHLKARGIILRITEIRESDLIVTLLLEQVGKISALARGARRSKRRFMGGLEVFDCAKFELSVPKARTNLYNLMSLAERETWLHLRDDFLKFSLASLLLETTNIFFGEGDPDAKQIFLPLHQTFHSLHLAANKNESIFHTVRFFLLLLRLSGLDPLKDHLPISAPVQQFWQQLSTEELSPDQVNPQILNESLTALSRHITTITGHPLKAALPAFCGT